MSLDDRLRDPEAGPQLIRLLELVWPEELEEDTLRLCSAALPPNYRGVEYDGEDYTLADFEFSEIRHVAGAERVRVELSIGNLGDPATGGAAGYWTTFVRTRDLNGTKVNLRVVEASLIADTTQEIPELRWFVSGYATDPRRIRFGLGSPFDSLMLETPGVPLASQTCLWASLGLYKKHPCNSVSTIAACAGTLSDCAKRFPAGAVLRIGPSFPLFAAGTRRRRG